MADTRNTEALFDDALNVALAESKKQPGRVRDLASDIHTYAQKHGFGEATAALGNALLAAAADHMDQAEKRARKQGVDDGPEVGDHVAEANRLLGVYEQVCAANRLACLLGESFPTGRLGRGRVRG